MPKLNILETELWEAMAFAAADNFFMYQDAQVFLQRLKERVPDLKVYTATTNLEMVILVKLTVGELADGNGSPFLDGAFGGEEVYPGGKVSPEFYQALLERIGTDKKTSLMIGDNPEMDLALAQKAGIKQIVLLRRSQDSEYVHEPDGGLCLKRLDVPFIFIN